MYEKTKIKTRFSACLMTTQDPQNPFVEIEKEEELYYQPHKGFVLSYGKQTGYVCDEQIWNAQLNRWECEVDFDPDFRRGLTVREIMEHNTRCAKELLEHGWCLTESHEET